jgi:hypothetical protein
MKAFSRLSRYGMTFKPLTEDLGAALLTWYLGASRAKISAQPEREQASQESAVGCGRTWRGSLARYDHDTSSWRTAQYSLLGDLELYSETWPRWGTMRSGECSEQSMPEHLTEENGFGYSLPTPTKSQSNGTCSKRFHMSEDYRGAHTVEALRVCAEDPQYLNPLLSDDLMGFPVGWTLCRPLETLKFQRWCDLHGIQYTND